MLMFFMVCIASFILGVSCSVEVIYKKITSEKAYKWKGEEYKIITKKEFEKYYG